MTGLCVTPILRSMNSQTVAGWVCAALACVGAGRLLAQEGVLAQDPVKGAALLADARTALGGDDKLRAVTTLQVKGSFRRTVGTNQVEGEIEMWLAPPDRMKRIEDTSLPGGGPAIVVTQGLSGTDVWDENSGGGRGGFIFAGPGGGGGGRGGFGGGGGGGQRGAGGNPGAGAGAGPDGAAAGRAAVDPERLRQAQLRQRQGDLSRLLLAWLLTTDAPVTWIGTAESPEGKADVLEITPAEGVPTRLFLDAASHLPLMLTWQGAAPQLLLRRGGPGRAGQPGGQPGGQTDAPPAPGAAAPAPDAPGDAAPAAARRGGGGQQATLQMTLADYKTVNGIKLPHTMTRGVNGQTNEEWSISSFKLNQTFKSSTFEKK